MKAIGRQPRVGARVCLSTASIAAKAAEVDRLW